MMQVIRNVCMECGVVTGCYVRNRIPDRLKCTDCKQCKLPDGYRDSHGYCDDCLADALKKIEVRRNHEDTG